MATLRVTLSDAPRDVLVYLVDHGPANAAAIVEAVAPKDADNPRQSVALALGLLCEVGWAAPLPHQMWRATVDGCKAVALAREGSAS